QYSLAEYPAHVGWAHSALEHALAFARLADVRHLVTFHHDPGHSDDEIDRLTAEATLSARPSFGGTSGAEGAVFDIWAPPGLPWVWAGRSLRPRSASPRPRPRRKRPGDSPGSGRPDRRRAVHPPRSPRPAAAASPAE